MRKDLALATDASCQVDAKLVLGDTGLVAYLEAINDPRGRDKDALTRQNSINK